MYKEDSLATLKNPQKLLDFVDEAKSGSRPSFYEQMKTKPEKHSVKIAGKDFEKRVFESKKDALVLIYHPEPEKNRGIKQKFEHFA
jgi:hypothetical protein